MEPTTTYEQQFWTKRLQVAGVDEAGRGALAGPVVAAAVILPPDPVLPMVRDSKQLTARQRESAYGHIIEQAKGWAIATATVAEIDEMNILRATMLAMQRAIQQLPIQPDVLLIDGTYFVSELSIPFVTIARGDQQSLSIACASILAKVWRDRWMVTYADAVFPQYGFARHKGYGTAYHRQMLRTFGPSALHRRTFVQRIMMEAQP